MSGTAQLPLNLSLSFVWAGLEGEVQVEIAENDDPAALGCEEFARGYPVCRATIAPAARGYDDMLGWIQLVDDSWHGGGFHDDGFEPLGPLPHPFGFYGVSPTLFDAPHHDGEDFDFLAHSFLCGLGGKLLEFRHEARAVLGFSWGCTKRGEEFEFLAPQAISAAGWERHREHLERRFPQWSFAPGYFRHPFEQ